MVLNSIYSIKIYLELEVYFKTMDFSAFSFHHLILRQFRYVVCCWDKKKKSFSEASLSSWFSSGKDRDASFWVEERFWQSILGSLDPFCNG